MMKIGELANEFVREGGGNFCFMLQLMNICRILRNKRPERPMSMRQRKEIQEMLREGLKW